MELFVLCLLDKWRFNSPWFCQLGFQGVLRLGSCICLMGRVVVPVLAVKMEKLPHLVGDSGGNGAVHTHTHTVLYTVIVLSVAK